MLFFQKIKLYMNNKLVCAVSCNKIYQVISSLKATSYISSYGLCDKWVECQKEWIQVIKRVRLYHHASENETWACTHPVCSF